MPSVLVIDDEWMICDLIRRALGRMDIQVDTADNALGGISKFEEGDFDLVITDVRMPGVDGYSVVHHIRNSDRGNTPVIGVSGTPWFLQNVDFDEVFPKPFAIQSLIKKVVDLINVPVSEPDALPEAVGSY